jgi:8-oxo-dGTP diphosphatase
MVMNDDKVLLGKRRGLHGTGEYAFPGGNLGHMESLAYFAAREIAEERGLEITNVRFLYVANVTKYAPKHYLRIGLVADWLYRT